MFNVHFVIIFRYRPLVWAGLACIGSDMQFTFNFEGKPETQFLMDEIDLAHHQIEKLCKSFFVRHNALAKEVKLLREMIMQGQSSKIVDLPLFQYSENRKEA
jgi:hypothetical protein